MGGLFTGLRKMDIFITLDWLEAGYLGQQLERLGQMNEFIFNY